MPLVPFWPFTITSTGNRTLLIAVPIGVDAQRTITNNATFGATIDGNPVYVTSLDVSVVFQGNPHLALTKTGSAPGIIQPGSAVTYSFQLKNDGNVVLNPPSPINDTWFGDSFDCEGGDLAIQGTLNRTRDYALASQDINKGRITNMATASYEYLGQTYTSPPSSVTLLIPPSCSPFARRRPRSRRWVRPSHMHIRSRTAAPGT